MFRGRDELGVGNLTLTIGVSQSKIVDEPLSPSALCDIPRFLFGKRVDDRPTPRYGSRTFPLEFPSRPSSPVSSIVYESSTCSDHDLLERIAELGNNWFENDFVPLNRRTKKAPKHRTEIYRVVPSSIGTIRPGIDSKQVITTQCSIEKLDTAQNGIHQLVIETCNDVLSNNPTMKIKESGIAMLIRIVDEYVQAVVEDFQIGRLC